ncbi:MAG: hypothetical protein SNJ85_06325, partial [Cyanobacteriota bacterium]
MQTEERPGLAGSLPSSSSAAVEVPETSPVQPEGSHTAHSDAQETQDIAEVGIPEELGEDPEGFPIALEGTTCTGSPAQQSWQAGDNYFKWSPSKEKRQQERRSLPWRLGLANLLSAGLHLLSIRLVDWQPGLPEEVEIISFQWVEVEAEPPAEPEFIAPISARASGTSDP